jgi:hypothetical protein
MAAVSGHHAVGYSIFGLAIVAIAGALAANHTLLAGIQTAKLQQTQAVQAISSVRGRTKQWPATQSDPMLNESERARIRAVNFTFKLDSVAAEDHKAYYFVIVGGRRIRVGVREPAQELALH